MKTNCYGSSLVGSTGINGDVFYISSDKKVFLLADGASGAGELGKVLMGKTCIELVKSFDYTESSLDPINYIKCLFNKINQKLIQLSQEYNKLVYGTIILAVVDNNILTITTFGDSPAYLYSKNSITRLAKNKKRYERMIEQGHITEEEYNSYIEQMHDMMKTCFDFFLPEIVPNNVIEQFPISSGDMLLMCCDGLSDWIAPKNVFNTIVEIGLEPAINKMILEAKELSLKSEGNFDDITAIALCW